VRPRPPSRVGASLQLLDELVQLGDGVDLETDQLCLEGGVAGECFRAAPLKMQQTQEPEVSLLVERERGSPALGPPDALVPRASSLGLLH
jgi:hypothetical protein